MVLSKEENTTWNSDATTYPARNITALYLNSLCWTCAEEEQYALRKHQDRVGSFVGFSLTSQLLLAFEDFNIYSRRKKYKVAFNDVSLRYKLPKDENKKWNDDLKEWLDFWSQFSRYVTILALENKFQNLIQSAQEGSKVRELVISFQLTSQNYPKIIESMKDRFGQEDMVVEMYIRELLRLVTKNIGRSLPIHAVYDKLESVIIALE
ncbi:hypothetical protein AVEN_188402-1 [Araneus ventricosus]|uniref:Uncharacterized protein n=1 Tax=Araneus ventricosus TaxID=182803 RepID=A0A4Y2VFJ5_ARAVE|nr:hypothetical protein AVEN_188402-1 [Araneus ventricosus]